MTMNLWGAPSRWWPRTTSDRATDFLRALIEAAAAMGSATTEAEIYERVFVALREHPIRPSLMLLDPADGRLRLHGVFAPGLAARAWKLIGIRREDFSMAIDATPEVAAVMREKKTVYVRDTAPLSSAVVPNRGFAVIRGALRIMGMSDVIMSPIIAEDTVLGFLSIHHRGMDESDVSVAALFAKHIGDAVARVRTIAELRTKTETIAAAQTRNLTAQRLEAMGALAGGIAHDFNNLLTIIMSSGSLALALMGKDDPARGDIDLLLDAAERAAALTSQLRDFSKQRAGRREVFDVAHRLEALAKLLRRTLGDAIELQMEVRGDGLCVHGDPSQFDQIVMNLAVNARDAMLDGGLLKISLDTQVAPTPMVVLTVCDNGVGMDDATAARVFEPFFSTKDGSHGTGLGLSTCFGIVSAWGGSIEVESTLHVGTCMRIALPQAKDAAVAAPIANGRGQSTPGRALRVLLVEDQQTLRDQLTRVLEGEGYSVVGCESGEAGLARFFHDEGNFDLLVTDVQLPGMCGVSLADEVLAHYPDLRVLLISGHMPELVYKRSKRVAHLPILWKPFVPRTFVAAVRDAVDASESPSS